MYIQLFTLFSSLLAVSVMYWTDVEADFQASKCKSLQVDTVAH